MHLHAVETRSPLRVVHRCCVAVVKSAWLLRLGRHTRYNGADSAQRRCKPKRIAKRRPSADWGLQLAPMKAELLVTAYQPWRGEYVPGPCTHRPSRHGSCQCLKSVG